jgi:hypothetical protein
MDIKYIGDNIIEIDGKVRIEVGPARIKAIATKELLDDKVTAAHYQVSQPVFDPSDPKKQIGWTSVDALGKPIKLGEEFTYIDWKGLQPPVHYVYTLETVEEVNDITGVKTKVDRWLPKDAKPTEQEALSAATSIAASRAASTAKVKG